MGCGPEVDMFWCLLDGEAAFPSVERNIQVRELFSAGERGDLLQYSRNTYQNTECHVKDQNQLSRRIVEHKGNRQGHVRASGHFKAYMNSCLNDLTRSNLGFLIGLLCITVVCVADDAYLLSCSPSGLQGALDIIGHSASRYQQTFNADKTAVVITGSRLDMQYYKDTATWTINGEKIKVVDSNDHLGLIVSGIDEEQKNVDANIAKCRSALFATLGPAFAYKCLLSPTTQLHVWRTCLLPVLLSGLPALPIRGAQIKCLTLFHNKILRGILKLSQSSPIPALHFLLGELPIEAILHIRTLGIFHNIWSNPSTTVFQMGLYILMMRKENSTTWFHHIQLLCMTYGLPNPSSLMKISPPWSRDDWNHMVKIRVTAWHERKLRSTSTLNSKMAYLNVELQGLSGRPHPVLMKILNVQEIKKVRAHLKSLF